MEKIINKNILVFDLETSGLPYSSNNKKFKKNKDDYPNYKNNKSYNNARIVSIAWCYIKNFSGNIKKNKEICDFFNKRGEFCNAYEDIFKNHVVEESTSTMTSLFDGEDKFHYLPTGLEDI
jgi:hypothetical protein